MKGRTPLHLACMYGHLEIVKLFVPVYPKLNQNDFMGVSPLKYAAMNGHFCIVHLIVPFLPKEERENILDII